jgi:hypothetical protein
MSLKPHATFVAGLSMLIATGCGGANPSDPVMGEKEHSHYHVHAIDASHEHSHEDDGIIGGHVHSHQHPSNELEPH